MERSVEIGARIRHHVDAPDLEARPVVVVRRRRLTGPEVADVRTRKPGVSRHPMLDHMAEVDDPLFRKIRHEANTPMMSHSTLSDALGNARCHQPLITNPAAPNTF